MSHSPMTVLRDLAQQKLEDTTVQLGKAQQTYQRAMAQLEQLESYQQEYQQQLRNHMADKGIRIADLVNQQSFIDSLSGVVRQHSTHVEACQHSIDRELSAWRRDKQRVNAFDTLNSRAETLRGLKESRQEQKMMDEFAQRACANKELL